MDDKRIMNMKWLAFLVLTVTVEGFVMKRDTVQDCEKIPFARSWWNATEPRKVHTQAKVINDILIHHTATGGCDEQTCQSVLKDIQRYEMNVLGKPDISFHFLIDRKGNMYTGLGWDVESMYRKNWPYTLDIAFLGNFATANASAEALQTLDTFLNCNTNRTNRIVPEFDIWAHRDVSCTTCPGNKLYNQIIHHKHYPDDKKPLKTQCYNSRN